VAPPVVEEGAPAPVSKPRTTVLGPTHDRGEVPAPAAVVSTRRSRLRSSAARLAQPSLPHAAGGWGGRARAAGGWGGRARARLETPARRAGTEPHRAPAPARDVSPLRRDLVPRSRSLAQRPTIRSA